MVILPSQSFNMVHLKMTPVLMIQEMNRTWKASFLGEITFNLGSVVVMQLLMIGIPDPTKKIILRYNNKSAIRHSPHPKILTVRPPPTPCRGKKNTT